MSNWNKLFTGLIRNSRPAYWGNWGLNTQIEAGAIGLVNADTGEFEMISPCIPGAEGNIKSEPTSSNWQMESTSVSGIQAGVEGKGSYKDPETGVDVEANLEVGWQMGKAGSIVSDFSLVREDWVEDIGQLVKDNWKWLVQKAETVGMSSNNSISQGFGVVTSVIWAESGLNLGAQEDNCSFTINGGAKALLKMLGRGEEGEGEGDPKVEVKGHFLNYNANKSIDRHIWPSKPMSVAPHPIPIAYRFTSFEGQLLVQDWVMQIPDFSLFFHNTGTYIVQTNVTYDSSKGHNNIHFELSGGLSKAIGDIPVDVTNLKVHMHFIGILNSDDHELHWGKPLHDWRSSQRHIELNGWWPGDTQVIDKEANQ